MCARRRLIGGLRPLETDALITRPLVGPKLPIFVGPVVFALVKALISLELRAQDEVPGTLATVNADVAESIPFPGPASAEARDRRGGLRCVLS